MPLGESVTDEELIEEVQRLAEELGRAPKSAEMNEEGRYHSATYQNHFGRWNDAVREAGLDPVRERNIPDERFLEAIRELAEELGETPTGPQMEEQGRYSTAGIRNRFGGWNNAVRAAGLEVRRASPGEAGDYGVNWTKVSRQIRDRDDHTCQGCGMLEEHHEERLGYGLEVHHICNVDDSSNPAVYNAPRNLISLCLWCHRRWERAGPGIPPEFSGTPPSPA